MTRKIFHSIFFVSLCVLLASCALLFGIMYRQLEQQQQQTLEQEIEYLAAGVQQEGIAYLDRLPPSELRITWVSKDGKVLYDNRQDPAAMENHLDREEIREALQTGEGSASRPAPTPTEKNTYLAKRLTDGSVLRVSDTQLTVGAWLLSLAQPVLLLLVAVLMLTALMAYWLSRRIADPINRIDPEHPDEKQTPPELRPLVERLSLQKRHIEAQFAELRARQTEFHAITSNMSEGLVVLDGRAEILSCNESARRLLGVNGKMPKSILMLRNEKEFRESIRMALSGHNSHCILHDKDTYYSVIATPVIHEKDVDGAVLVILDETEKEAREQLRREFTTNVSHELKTPLTSISGFAEVIRDGLAEGDDARRFAANICKESGRLITLVGDIIRLTQLDGGEIPYDREQVELYLLAEDVISRLQPIAARHEVTLRVIGDRPSVSGNRQILEEMLYNLCDNGIKYNRPGGYVEIRLTDDEDSVAVTVQDNGIGIPENDCERVFERFYRVDKSHSKAIGGTGLGLSIVKHAAQYHKATITLKSEEGSGTTITLLFSKNELQEF